ncbi:efflux transporter outer membrane subunit [Pseudomonas sp. CCM 7893]|uniref:Efflux transporter outer membrane subunit n=1 Tax=Pseudomonas spelaei TaxID=1055469 RepID=A0A6I3WFU0_9PSED|nr:efflux transporter outer membrane subunit [Pseudomonas spelaei]
MLVALAGCSVAPLPELKPPTPDAWRNAQRPLSPQQPDLNQWWQAFNDPQLNALVDRALQNNLDVAQAVERLRAIRVISQHAQSPYLPSLSINTKDAVSPDTSTSYFLIGFDSVWELPLFGAKQSADRLAQGNKTLVETDLRRVQVSLVAEVSRRWIELRAAQQMEHTLAAIRDIQHEKLALLLVREQLALAPHSDVAAAQVELAQAQMALTRPRQRINRSAQQLAVLSGQNEPDPLWLQPGPPPTLGHWQLNSVPTDLLRTRPEIASAEAEVIVAAGELGMSRADIYPHISFGTSLQWSLNIASNRRKTPSGNSIFSAGPGISIPLFDWGQRVANAKAKDHQMQAAVLAYRQSVLEGIAETETAMGDLEQLRVREQSSRQAYTATQTRLDALQQQAGLGLLSTLDLSNAQVEKLRAQHQVDRASAERNIAYVALYKALGGAPLPATSLKDTD